ncbi:tRNA-splicing endonuclease subunit Sen54, partial [Mucuna pruriens]
MEGKTWGCSSSEDSDDEVYLQNASDEEELHFSSGSMPKLQFRNKKSKSCWNEEMRMGEVTEKNGKMWVTTGIVRSGKIYSSTEETLYLMELGCLHILDNDGRSISLIEMYQKVAGRNSECCWELFEVYRHLKSLGYIVGRHGVAWSLKSVKSSHKPVALEGTQESKQLVDTDSKSELSINKLFGELQINDSRPDFDVYLPNSRFRKSSPGEPSFLLYLSRGYPPSREEIEALERQCGGIPLKICLVTDGRVSFFSFDKVEIPDPMICKKAAESV